MDNKVYLVEGCEGCGSYEDFCSYTIKVFLKKENAEKFVEEYNKKIDDINNLVCDSKLTKEDYYNIECDDNGPILPDGITMDDYNKIEEVINESYRGYGYANIIEKEIEDYE